MISVIDYGMGNIKSVSKALEAVGAQIKITQNPEDIKKNQKLLFFLELELSVIACKISQIWDFSQLSKRKY